MRVRRLRGVWVLALAATLLAGGGSAATAAATTGPVTQTGTLGGANYLIEIPANWNGTLVLYSHGYVAPCNVFADPTCDPVHQPTCDPLDQTCNPARDVGDPFTGSYLKSHGYALAGSAYRATGWAVKEALQDQIALLDFFDQTFGTPKRTIAWGHSLGGIITAGLVQRFPQRFDGALPMCGVLAGGVGVWNSALDSEFVLKTLLAPDDSNLELVNITDPPANLREARQVLAAAMATPEGRARVALASAVADLPGWFTAGSPEPAANDFASRLSNQFRWNNFVDFPFVFDLRAELEARAHGNPSWNTGVDYAQLLARSIDKDEVAALYAAAGLNLEDDLATLARAPRIAAERRSVEYLRHNIVFDGELGLPVLTLHTTGDGLVAVQDEQAYASVVAAAGDQEQLRETFVHRAGHCTFTPAETIADFNALVRRLDTGEWSGLSPAALNAAAAALGPTFNVALPAFVEFQPSEFLRPFSVRHGR